MGKFWIFMVIGMGIIAAAVVSLMPLVNFIMIMLGISSIGVSIGILYRKINSKTE